MVLSAVIAVTASLLAGVAISQDRGGYPGMKILRQVLRPAQLTVLKDFRTAHKAEQIAALNRKLEVLNAREALLTAVTLTSAQQASLTAIVQSQLGQVNSVTQPLYNSSLALRQAVTADNPNQATILAAAAQLGNNIGNAAVFAAGMVKSARTVLTADQITAIATFITARDAAQQSALNDLPTKASDFFTLAGQLNLTPDQIGGILAGIKANQPLFEERRAARRDEWKAEVDKILTPAQLEVIAEAKAQHPHKGGGMHGKKLDEAIQLWTDLNLTQPQMDALLKIAQDNESNIIPFVNSITRRATSLETTSSPEAPSISRKTRPTLACLSATLLGWRRRWFQPPSRC